MASGYRSSSTRASKTTARRSSANVNRHYEPGRLNLAILTHPDEDHINGMGEVIRGLNVDTLWLHRIGAHGGGALPATKAVEDLILLANDEGTEVYEVFAGEQAFGGALTILGPDEGLLRRAG